MSQNGREVAEKIIHREDPDIPTRTGDVATKRVGHHAQPPCEYFRHVADTGFEGRPFPKLRLVHEHASPLNPCAEALAKDPRVSDQPREGRALGAHHDGRFEKASSWPASVSNS